MMTGDVVSKLEEAVRGLDAAAAALRYVSEHTEEERRAVDLAWRYAGDTAEMVRAAGRRMVGWEG